MCEHSKSGVQGWWVFAVTALTAGACTSVVKVIHFSMDLRGQCVNCLSWKKYVQAKEVSKRVIPCIAVRISYLLQSAPSV